MAMGLLIRKYPNLIAGYNTMPPDRKAKVDIDGLSNWMQKGFVLMGLIIVLGPYTLPLIGLQSLNDSIIFIAVFGIVPILLIGAQRFDHNNDNKVKKVLLPVIIVIAAGGFVVVLIAYGTAPPTIILEDDRLNISGMYGVDCKVTDLELLDNLPEVEMRTNGFHYGTVSKGNFRFENGSSAMLFLESETGPYIKVTSLTTPVIYINRASGPDTHTEFERMSKNLNP